MRPLRSVLTVFMVVALAVALAAPALAKGKPGGGGSATPCTFADDAVGMTMTLQEDCTTDSTIVIPDGYTLDGAGFTINAVDPAGGHFTGAVVMNGGAAANVKHLTVTATGLANVCDAGADRLRGIMFEGASGVITKSRITGINQGPSGCQEGNAIEVRNAPFNGTHPGTVAVELSHNVVADYQKTGIVANGDVDVYVAHNAIGASATQENLAANSLQLGFGATGTVILNTIDGNQWMGTSDWAATAVLISSADGVVFEKNHIRGNSDVGLYVYGNDGVFDRTSWLMRVWTIPIPATTTGLGTGATTTPSRRTR